MTSQKDFVTPRQTVNRSLTYDQKDLYKFLQHWFIERNYDFIELDYTEKLGTNGKRVYAFRWQNERKLEPLIKSIIEVEFRAETENVQVETHDKKRKTMQNGDVSITVTSYLLREVDSEWALRKESVYFRFIREVYDKYLGRGGRLTRYHEDVKNDVKMLLADIRSYLRVHRYD